MIKFSKREDYAFVLLNYLFKNNKKDFISLSEVALKYNISPNFLGNIANQLRKNKIIGAKEGKNGGYFLIKNPKKLKVGEILAIFSKNLLTDCFACPKEKFCETGKIWEKFNKEFLNKIYNLSFYQFINKK
ncbi:MAG: Rrf2 family transcriptional regulator [Patescibacteria group bacterium]|nr:Rrf2 family transcriptional regulator [Patescibacteria group bacterium]